MQNPFQHDIEIFLLFIITMMMVMMEIMMMVMTMKMMVMTMKMMVMTTRAVPGMASSCVPLKTATKLSVAGSAAMYIPAMAD